MCDAGALDNRLAKSLGKKRIHTQLTLVILRYESLCAMFGLSDFRLPSKRVKAAGISHLDGEPTCVPDANKASIRQSQYSCFEYIGYVGLCLDLPIDHAFSVHAGETSRPQLGTDTPIIG